MWVVQFFLIVVPLFLILGILLWFFNRGMDEDRVRGWLETRGNKLLECIHTPTNKGWWAEARERFYDVRYLDTDGHEHFAMCRTGLITGLIWTSDKFLRYADQVEGVPMPGQTEIRRTSVEEENRRRAELERLKKTQK